MNALDNVLKVSAVVCLTTVTIFTGVVGVKVYRTIDNFNAVGESLNEASKIGVDFLNSLRNSISDETLKKFDYFLSDLGTFLNNPNSIKDLTPQEREKHSTIAISFVEFLNDTLIELRGKEGSEMIKKINSLIKGVQAVLLSIIQVDGSIKIKGPAGMEFTLGLGETARLWKENNSEKFAEQLRADIKKQYQTTRKNLY